MKLKKRFFVIAYDVRDDKRRTKVVKVLEHYGIRVNFSVFECVMTLSQYKLMKDKLREVSDAKEDHILIYPLCIDCFSKIEAVAGLLPASGGVVNVI